MTQGQPFVTDSSIRTTSTLAHLRFSGAHGLARAPATSPPSGLVSRPITPMRHPRTPCHSRLPSTTTSSSRRMQRPPLGLSTDNSPGHDSSIPSAHVPTNPWAKPLPPLSRSPGRKGQWTLDSQKEQPCGKQSDSKHHRQHRPEEPTLIATGRGERPKPEKTDMKNQIMKQVIRIAHITKPA